MKDHKGHKYNQIGRQKYQPDTSKITLCLHGSNATSIQLFRDFFTLGLAVFFFKFESMNGLNLSFRRPMREYYGHIKFGQRLTKLSKLKLTHGKRKIQEV